MADIVWVNKIIDKKEPINKFLKETNSEFHIISSNFDKLKTNFDYNTIFKEWDKNTYIEKISKFNVGIMPLLDTEWSKGKCSIGGEAISNKDRYDTFLCQKLKKNIDYEYTGRKVVEEEYSISQNAKK